MTLTLWHNPRCSKSRETLALLQARGLEPTLRLYLDDPPDAAEICAVRTALGVPMIGMMRPTEALFGDLGLSAKNDDESLLAAMLAHPRLIQRPILLNGAKAAIGRPPESVLNIV